MLSSPADPLTDFIKLRAKSLAMKDSEQFAGTWLPTLVKSWEFVSFKGTYTPPTSFHSLFTPRRKLGSFPFSFFPLWGGKCGSGFLDGNWQAPSPARLRQFQSWVIDGFGCIGTMFWGFGNILLLLCCWRNEKLHLRRETLTRNHTSTAPAQGFPF